MRGKFDKFNSTGEQMLDSIYLDIKITLKMYFWRENARFCHL